MPSLLLRFHGRLFGRQELRGPLYGQLCCRGCLLYRRGTRTDGLSLRPVKRRSVALQLEAISHIPNMARPHVNLKANG